MVTKSGKYGQININKTSFSGTLTSRRMKNGLRIMADGYEVLTDNNKPYLITLCPKSGGKPASLVIASDCDTDNGKDSLLKISLPELTRYADRYELIWRAAGSQWQWKEYHLVCRPEGLEYFYRVKGRKCAVTDCWFFRCRRGSGMLQTDFPWPLIFTPNADSYDKRHYLPSEVVSISVNRHAGNAALTPAPFCFGCYDGNGKWAMVGMAAKPGEYNFMQFQCRDLSFCLTYEGHRRVEKNSMFETPHLIIQFDLVSEYDCLEKYMQWLYRHDYLSAGGEAGLAKHPDWWRQPLFCGWGTQVGEVYVQEGYPWEHRAPFKNTQVLYEQTLALLESKGISPGIIVVDEGWQDDETYHAEGRAHPVRWPDLRGFIDAQHRQGRKVLLWFGTWCRQGVPIAECVVKGNMPLTVDASNIVYQQRLRRVVKKMISSDPDCYNADGLKLDHLQYLPSEATPKSPLRWGYDVVIPPDKERIRAAGSIWGCEMLHALLRTIHSELKHAKPEAVMATFAANPYLSEFTDLFQLGDIGIPCLSLSRMMEHRFKMAKIICPRWVIYSADWAPTSHAQWRDYLPVMSAIGMPCLHFSTHISASAPLASQWRWEPMTELDYRLVARSWKEYRRRLGLPAPSPLKNRE